VIGGACVGVPFEPLCDDDVCTEGVACSAVHEADGQTALDEALGKASAGECIALFPGDYAAVALPGGVSLLGPSYRQSRVAEVSAGPGDGAVIRGLETHGPVVLAEGATHVAIDRVHISGSGKSGIVVAPGASVTVTQTTVAQAAIYGIFARAPLELVVASSVVTGSGYVGLWVDCGEPPSEGAPVVCDCAAPSKPKLVVSQSSLRDNHVAGVAVYGVAATLSDTVVRRTEVGVAGPAANQFGMGVSIASCSEVNATGLSSLDNRFFGVLVDESTVQLGQLGDGLGIRVDGNLFGIWLQNISKTVPQRVTITNATLVGNLGTGLRVGGEYQGPIVVCHSAIGGTVTTDYPTVRVPGENGVTTMGHGVMWEAGSRVTVEDLDLHDNGTAGFVIHGDAEGSLIGVTLSGGDEAVGIVQQALSGTSRVMTIDAPTPTTTADTRFAVPEYDQAL
jgi:hypothetical protein